MNCFWPINSTAVIIPKEYWNTNSKEPMHPNVYSSTIYNSHAGKSLSDHQYMNDQKSMVHLHNGILHTRKKERAPFLWDSMDGSGEHYAKWNKPGSEKQIPYGLTYKGRLNNKTNKQTKYNDRHGNLNKMTLTRGDGGGW